MSFLLKSSFGQKWYISGWWFQIVFYVHPYLVKRSNLTHMFQMVWFNHQLDTYVQMGWSNHQQLGIFPVACSKSPWRLRDTEVSQGGHDLLLNQGEVCCVESFGRHNNWVVVSNIANFYP